MWSTAFDPIKFDWFYLDRLRRSSRPLQAGITAEDRLWVKRRSSQEPNQMHNHVNVWNSLDLSNFRKRACAVVGFRFYMAAFRAIVNKRYPDDEDSCMSCLTTTKYCCLRCKWTLCDKCSVPEENEETPGWKPGKSVAYCEHRRKERRETKTKPHSRKICFPPYVRNCFILICSYHKLTSQVCCQSVYKSYGLSFSFEQWRFFPRGGGWGSLVKSGREVRIFFLVWNLRFRDGFFHLNTRARYIKA